MLLLLIARLMWILKSADVKRTAAIQCAYSHESLIDLSGYCSAWISETIDEDGSHHDSGGAYASMQSALRPQLRSTCPLMSLWHCAPRDI
ncbi:hypothetical protein BDN67DRAFT_970369 [Paxillus ammoniavirescens]|nr:hypothetical protein BDN67DRAFT_970369 [Paxillus ammoniavirescens]